MYFLNMNILYLILNYLGVDLNSDVSVFVKFLYVIILLSVIIVICLLNVLFYFLIIYLIEDLKILDKFTKFKLPNFVLSLIKLYKNTRKLFIVYEVCFALFIALMLIWLCSRIVYGVM